MFDLWPSKVDGIEIWPSEICVKNFIQIGSKLWPLLCLQTNKETNKQTYIQTVPINILGDFSNSPSNNTGEMWSFMKSLKKWYIWKLNPCQWIEVVLRQIWSEMTSVMPWCGVRRGMLQKCIFGDCDQTIGPIDFKFCRMMRKSRGHLTND